MKVIKNGFTNERLGVELDVYVIGGKEWFKAQDISEYLDYEDTNKMTRTIEITGTNSCRHNVGTAQGNEYEALFINESALYEIVFTIRKTNLERYEKAREFQKWVFSEVLPSIRKNNYYIDDKYVTRVQYDRLKDTVLLFCENGKIGLPTASEKIFGDKRELNKRLILAKKINRDTCWYDSEWRCADGDNKYPIFVCDTKGKYSDGEVNNTLQVSLTNHGFVYLREFFNKHPLAWSSELQQKIF